MIKLLKSLTMDATPDTIEHPIFSKFEFQLLTLDLQKSVLCCTALNHNTFAGLVEDFVLVVCNFKIYIHKDRISVDL